MSLKKEKNNMSNSKENQLVWIKDYFFNRLERYFNIEIRQAPEKIGLNIFYNFRNPFDLEGIYKSIALYCDDTELIVSRDIEYQFFSILSRKAVDELMAKTFEDINQLYSLKKSFLYRLKFLINPK